jgi:hypothetical protein
VQTSLKSIVHEVKFICCDDEISFILHMSCSSTGVNVVHWMVLGFGVVEKDRTVCILLWVLRYLLFCFFLNVLSSWESAIKSGVWMNLAVCLLHSVRIKKNIKCGVV